MIALIPAALLWIPSEDFTAWQQLAETLQDQDDVRLTIALSPSMIRPGVEEALQPLIDDERVEVAARIDGDPWLPAVAQVRRHDVPRRIAAAADAFRLAFASVTPAGFVPAGGAWDASWNPALKAAGFSWAATALPPWPSDGLAVIDEALGPSKPGALFEMLADPPGRRWLTLSKAFKVDDTTSAPSPWASSPLESPEGARLWTEYENTAAAVKRYQNSGSADLGKLGKATNALHAAQASRYYKDADEQGLRIQLDRALDAIGALSNEVRVSSWSGALNVTGGKLGLDVSWTEEEISLRFKPAEPQPADALFDLYIDVNGVPGAGRQTLLPGRTGQVPPRDAWEVAVEVSNNEARLFRAGSQVHKTPVTQEPGGVAVVLPRSLLRGNPGGWGYAAAAFPAGGGQPLVVMGAALRAVRAKRQ
jgi:hypothetical protein